MSCALEKMGGVCPNGVLNRRECSDELRDMCTDRSGSNGITWRQPGRVPVAAVVSQATLEAAGRINLGVGFSVENKNS